MKALLLAAVGFGAGILSAWGVGGGTLLLLAMTLFLGMDPQTARGINLLFFLPTAATALVLHAKQGSLDLPTLKHSVPWAIPAAMLGAWIATSVDTESMRRPFGVYLLLSALLLLWPSKKKTT